MANPLTDEEYFRYREALLEFAAGALLRDDQRLPYPVLYDVVSKWGLGEHLESFLKQQIQQLDFWVELLMRAGFHGERLRELVEWVFGRQLDATQTANVYELYERLRAADPRLQLRQTEAMLFLKYVGPLPPLQHDGPDPRDVQRAQEIIREAEAAAARLSELRKQEIELAQRLQALRDRLDLDGFGNDDDDGGVATSVVYSVDGARGVVERRDDAASVRARPPPAGVGAVPRIGAAGALSPPSNRQGSNPFSRNLTAADAHDLAVYSTIEQISNISGELIFRRDEHGDLWGLYARRGDKPTRSHFVLDPTRLQDAIAHCRALGIDTDDKRRFKFVYGHYQSHVGVNLSTGKGYHIRVTFPWEEAGSGAASSAIAAGALGAAASIAR